MIKKIVKNTLFSFIPWSYDIPLVFHTVWHVPVDQPRSKNHKIKGKRKKYKEKQNLKDESKNHKIKWKRKQIYKEKQNLKHEKGIMF